LIIGIAGGTGSGKTTVAKKIAQALPQASVAFLDMDGYYRNLAHLPMDERRRSTGTIQKRSISTCLCRT
jgi:uridine kinase